MSDASSPQLLMEVYSVRPSVSPEAGAALGEILLRHAEFTPEKFGPWDPARSWVKQLDRQLADYVAKRVAKNDVDVVFESFKAPRVSGEVGLMRNPFIDRFGWPTTVELYSEASWYVDGARLDAFVDLFVDLVEGFDAFYGFVTESGINLQREGFKQRPEIRAGLPPGIPPQRTHFLNRALPDVYWVQFLGPAYLEWWGSGRFDGLGVRQRSTANGGLVVWSTESPFVLNPQMQTHDGYPWKKPFYAALGDRAILRIEPDHVEGEDGELVPPLRRHVDFLQAL